LLGARSATWGLRAMAWRLRPNVWSEYLSSRGLYCLFGLYCLSGLFGLAWRRTAPPGVAREDPLIVLYGLLGAVIGSFLNVCIDRLPDRLSLVRPPSHCPSCQRRLSPLELVPVISFLLLRGRCRTCRAEIPRRALVVEALAAVLFAWLWFRFGPGWPVLAASFYTSLLIVILFIDLEHRLVLNRVTYPAMGAALVLAALRSLPGDPLALAPIAPVILSSLLGGALGFVIIFIPAWITKGGIGGGDVKLGALMGLFLGFPAVFAGLFLGFLGGGVGAVVLLVTRVRGRRDAVPYAPFLAAGAWVALLYGNQIVAWYVGRFA
jgi:leader peptidase (prepilin peptidase)/N-methyltransferase